MGEGGKSVAVVCPGSYSERRETTGASSRFADIFAEFDSRGVTTELAVYHDDFCDEVKTQLLQVDAVLVWVNPIQDGRNRSVLDHMLRQVASAGVFVSTHPDVVLKLGTKEVLYRTRELGWGCDTHLYRSTDQMKQELGPRLARGKARVLKQLRGSSGDGVWRVQSMTDAASPITDQSPLRVRHAKRGSVEKEMSFAGFLAHCESYYDGSGAMIDQVYQERLPEGTVRCYLVHNQVVGFGLQEINALYPAPAGVDASAAPQPGPRLYHPPTLPEYQGLKNKLEQEWVAAAVHLLQIETGNLPVLWDCDFLLGPKNQYDRSPRLKTECRSL